MPTSMSERNPALSKAASLASNYFSQEVAMAQICGHQPIFNQIHEVFVLPDEQEEPEGQIIEIKGFFVGTTSVKV